MTLEQRLSAVAKRRRLNSSISRTVNASTSPGRSQSPAKNSIPRDQSIVTTEEFASKAHLESNINEFSALVDKNIVKFSHFREIETLKNGAVKIRLSKGQKCFVSGVYALWIKGGTVDFLGARLEAASRTYHVCTSTEFELSAIVASSNIAELEIEPDLQDFAWSNASLNTFHVHGNLDSVDTTMIQTPQGSDDRNLNDISRKISLSDLNANNDLGPTVLVCGKQSPGTAMQVTSIINSMITARNSTKAVRFAQGVLLLDLDLETPAFAPPGTVSIVHILEPVLGPPYMRPGVQHSTTKTAPFRILKMQYSRTSDLATSECLRLDPLIPFIHRMREQEHQRCPLIVKANGWLDNKTSAYILEFVKAFVPDFVLCFGSETTSNSGRLEEVIAAGSGAHNLFSIPISSTRAGPLRVQHELILRSYFHFRGYETNNPKWKNIPLVLDKDRQLWLSLGKPGAHIDTVLVHGLRVDVGDLFDAINGCTVAINLSNEPIMERPEQITAAHSVVTSDQRKQYHGNVGKGSFGSSECLGLGIILGFSFDEGRICLLTPVPCDVFEYHKQLGDHIALVVQKAGSDGRFDTTWIQLETEGVLGARNPSKAVCTQKLDVGIVRQR